MKSGVESPDVALIECPRDAMQGLHEFIPTKKKIEYHRQLLKCGFHTLDIGSFVSPKAIPQLKDTSDVLDALDISTSASKLLVIVGNARGAEVACSRNEVTFIGFPFSISETFLRRNINSSIADSLNRLEDIQELCVKHGKQLVVYVSMGFGNPYGEPWNADILIGWSHKLVERCEAGIISLSDTIGTSRPDNIRYVFRNLIPSLPEVSFGAHLHTTPTTWREKVEAAYRSGCRRFDGAIKGYGGCPMAADRLTGNMPMENMVSYFKDIGVDTGINEEAFDKALQMSVDVFPL